MDKQDQTLLLGQNYLDAILEHCQDGVYITDNEANTVFLNHAYERIGGLLRAEIIGKNMRDLVKNGVVSASGTLSVLQNGESIPSNRFFAPESAQSSPALRCMRTRKTENTLSWWSPSCVRLQRFIPSGENCSG